MEWVSDNNKSQELGKKIVETWSLMFTREMCEKAVDKRLYVIKFAIDCFVIPKTINYLNNKVILNFKFVHRHTPH